MQKTPNFDLATSALRFDKNPAKILSSQLSSIEDSSLAIIVTYKTVSARVNEIKTKFGLTESGGEEWRQTVGEIGKKKKKKIERETNKTKNKERKEAHKKRNEFVKKRDEWLDENVESDDDASDTQDEENVLLPSPGVKREKRTASNFIVTDIKPKKVAKKRPVVDPTKTADPFFLTGTGETYLATKIIDRVQPHGPNDGLDRKERRAQQFGGTTTKTVAKRQSVPTESSAPKKSISIPEDLHPSWAAKMKSKGIDTFKGKRMRFDDDVETSNVVSKTVASPQPSQSNGDQEKIHPSWAAKQKLKPVISEFKGNKIVFDD